jgi:branched-chain amino acid transport system permease protein
LANKLDWLTGGADGLQGVVMGPVLGQFEFDLSGRRRRGTPSACCWCSLCCPVVLCNSPFGATLKAIRDNRLACHGHWHPGAFAPGRGLHRGCRRGRCSGRLLAQTTGFASLDLFEFHRSADVMLMLVIGGGWLYGGVTGAIVFKLMQDVISSITPQYWTFWIGLFLVVLVLVGRERLLGPGPGSKSEPGRQP